jgi:hypothetical protein
VSCKLCIFKKDLLFEAFPCAVYRRLSLRYQGTCLSALVGTPGPCTHLHTPPPRQLAYMYPCSFMVALTWQQATTAASSPTS